MDIEIPPELQWVAVIVSGGPWPKLRETQVRAVATTWRDAVPMFRDLSQSLTAGLSSAVDSVGGKGGQSFVDYINGLGTDGPNTMHQFAESASDVADGLDETALAVETAKLQTIGILIWIATELIWAAALAVFTAGASEAVAEALVQQARAAAWAVAKSAVQAIATGAVMMAGIDTLTQAVEMWAGDRKHFDFHSVLESAGTGALAGAFGVGLGLGRFAPRLNDSAWGRSISGGINGAVTNYATQVTVSGAQGQLNLDPLGLVAGGVPGLTAGLHGHTLPTQARDIPRSADGWGPPTDLGHLFGPEAPALLFEPAPNGAILVRGPEREPVPAASSTIEIQPEPLRAPQEQKATVPELAVATPELRRVVGVLPDTMVIDVPEQAPSVGRSGTARDQLTTVWDAVAARLPEGAAMPSRVVLTSASGSSELAGLQAFAAEHRVTVIVPDGTAGLDRSGAGLVVQAHSGAPGQWHVLGPEQSPVPSSVTSHGKPVLHAEVGPVTGPVRGTGATPTATTPVSMEDGAGRLHRFGDDLLGGVPSAGESGGFVREVLQDSRLLVDSQQVPPGVGWTNMLASDDPQAKTNCVVATIATDWARETGEAHFASLDHELSVSFLAEHAGRDPVQVSGYGEITELMDRAPVGARGIVIVNLAGRPGHAFNVFREQGGVLYFDGQSGTRNQVPADPTRVRFLPTTDDVLGPPPVRRSFVAGPDDVLGSASAGESAREVGRVLDPPREPTTAGGAAHPVQIDGPPLVHTTGGEARGARVVAAGPHDLDRLYESPPSDDSMIELTTVKGVHPDAVAARASRRVVVDAALAQELLPAARLGLRADGTPTYRAFADELVFVPPGQVRDTALARDLAAGWVVEDVPTGIWVHPREYAGDPPAAHPGGPVVHITEPPEGLPPEVQHAVDAIAGGLPDGVRRVSEPYALPHRQETSSGGDAPVGSPIEAESPAVPAVESPTAGPSTAESLAVGLPAAESPTVPAVEPSTVESRAVEPRAVVGEPAIEEPVAGPSSAAGSRAVPEIVEVSRDAGPAPQPEPSEPVVAAVPLPWYLQGHGILGDGYLADAKGLAESALTPRERYRVRSWINSITDGFDLGDKIEARRQLRRLLFGPDDAALAGGVVAEQHWTDLLSTGGLVKAGHRRIELRYRLEVDGTTALSAPADHEGVAIAFNKFGDTTYREKTAEASTTNMSGGIDPTLFLNTVSGINHMGVSVKVGGSITRTDTHEVAMEVQSGNRAPVNAMNHVAGRIRVTAVIDGAAHPTDENLTLPGVVNVAVPKVFSTEADLAHLPAQARALPGMPNVAKDGYHEVVDPAAIHALPHVINAMVPEDLVTAVRTALRDAGAPMRTVIDTSHEVAKEFFNDREFKPRNQWWGSDSLTSAPFAVRGPWGRARQILPGFLRRYTPKGFDGHFTVNATLKRIGRIGITDTEVPIRDDIAETYTEGAGLGYTESAQVTVGWDPGAPFGPHAPDQQFGPHLATPSVTTGVDTQRNFTHAASAQGQAKAATTRSDLMVRYGAEYAVDIRIVSDQFGEMQVTANMPAEIGVAYGEAHEFEERVLGHILVPDELPPPQRVVGTDVASGVDGVDGLSDVDVTANAGGPAGASNVDGAGGAGARDAEGGAKGAGDAEPPPGRAGVRQPGDRMPLPPDGRRQAGVLRVLNDGKRIELIGPTSNNWFINKAWKLRWSAVRGHPQATVHPAGTPIEKPTGRIVYRFGRFGGLIRSPEAPRQPLRPAFPSPRRYLSGDATRLATRGFDLPDLRREATRRPIEIQAVEELSAAGQRHLRDLIGDQGGLFRSVQGDSRLFRSVGVGGLPAHRYLLDAEGRVFAAQHLAPPRDSDLTGADATSPAPQRPVSANPVREIPAPEGSTPEAAAPQAPREAGTAASGDRSDGPLPLESLNLRVVAEQSNPWYRSSPPSAPAAHRPVPARETDGELSRAEAHDQARNEAQADARGEPVRALGEAAAGEPARRVPDRVPGQPSNGDPGHSPDAEPGAEPATARRSPHPTSPATEAPVEDAAANGAPPVSPPPVSPPPGPHTAESPEAHVPRPDGQQPPDPSGGGHHDVLHADVPVERAPDLSTQLQAAGWSGIDQFLRDRGAVQVQLDPEAVQWVARTRSTGSDISDVLRGSSPTGAERARLDALRELLAAPNADVIGPDGRPFTGLAARPSPGPAPSPGPRQGPDAGGYRAQGRILVGRDGQLFDGLPVQEHVIDPNALEPPALMARQGLGSGVVREISGAQNILPVVRDALDHQFAVTKVEGRLSGTERAELARTLAEKFGVPGLRGQFRGLIGGGSIGHQIRVGGHTFEIQVSAKLGRLRHYVDVGGDRQDATGQTRPGKVSFVLDSQNKGNIGLSMGERRSLRLGLFRLNFGLRLKAAKHLSVDLHLPSIEVRRGWSHRLVGGNGIKWYHRAKTSGPVRRFTYDTEYTVTVTATRADSDVRSVISRTLRTELPDKTEPSAKKRWGKPGLDYSTVVSVARELLRPELAIAPHLLRMGRVEVADGVAGARLRADDQGQPVPLEETGLAGATLSLIGTQRVVDEAARLMAERNGQPWTTGTAEQLRGILAANGEPAGRYGVNEMVRRAGSPTFMDSLVPELTSAHGLVVSLPKTPDGWHQSLTIKLRVQNSRYENSARSVALEHYGEADYRSTVTTATTTSVRTSSSAGLVIPTGSAHKGAEDGASRKAGSQVTGPSGSLSREVSWDSEEARLGGSADLNIASYTDQSHQFRADAVYEIVHQRWRYTATGRFERQTSEPRQVRVDAAAELTVTNTRAADLSLHVPSERGVLQPPQDPLHKQRSYADKDVAMAISEVERVTTTLPAADGQQLVASDGVLTQIKRMLIKQDVFTEDELSVGSDVVRGLNFTFSDQAIRGRYGSARSTGIHQIITVPRRRRGGVSHIGIRVTADEDAGTHVRGRPDVMITTGGQAFSQHRTGHRFGVRNAGGVEFGGRYGGNGGLRAGITASRSYETGRSTTVGEAVTHRDIRRAMAKEGSQEFDHKVTFTIELFHTKRAAELIHQVGTVLGAPFALADWLTGHQIEWEWNRRFGPSPGLGSPETVDGHASVLVPTHLTGVDTHWRADSTVGVEAVPKRKITVTGSDLGVHDFADGPAREPGKELSLARTMHALALPHLAEVAAWLPAVADPAWRPPTDLLRPHGAGAFAPPRSAAQAKAEAEAQARARALVPGTIDGNAVHLALDERNLRANIYPLLHGTFEIPLLDGEPIKVRAYLSRGRWRGRALANAMNFPEYSVEPEFERDRVWRNRETGLTPEIGHNAGDPVLGSDEPTLLDGTVEPAHGTELSGTNALSTGTYVESSRQRNNADHDYYLFDVTYEVTGANAHALRIEVPDGLVGLVPTLVSRQMHGHGIDAPPPDADELVTQWRVEPAEQPQPVAGQQGAAPAAAAGETTETVLFQIPDQEFMAPGGVPFAGQLISRNTDDPSEVVALARQFAKHHGRDVELVFRAADGTHLFYQITPTTEPGWLPPRIELPAPPPPSEWPESGKGKGKAKAS